MKKSLKSIWILWVGRSNIYRSKLLIAYLSKILKESGSFYFIVSDNKIFKFDKNGGFVSYIGQNGQGPQEFIGASQIHPDDVNDHLYVMDYFGRIIAGCQQKETPADYSNSDFPIIYLSDLFDEGIYYERTVFNNYFPEATAFFLENTSEFEVREIKKIEISDSLFFLQHQNKLYSYTSDGNHYWSYNINVSTFDIDTISERIIIYDSSNQSLSVYTFDNNFVQDFKIDKSKHFSDIKYLKDNIILLTSSTFPELEVYLFDMGNSSLKPLTNVISNNNINYKHLQAKVSKGHVRNSTPPLFVFKENGDL